MTPDMDYKSAVIDVGSNSVRMVVFKGLTRHPKILFNERMLCGLGRDLSNTGRMHDEGVQEAKDTMLRFKMLCDDMEVNDVAVLATAAVRDAENGPEFAQWIYDNCGFTVDIISGKTEAMLSAYGVMSAFPGADGLVGDLGGGSLELIHISKGKIKNWISLPIGPLRLKGMELQKGQTHKKIIKDAINAIDWLSDAAGKPLYMVGGSWRTISKLHISNTHWPSKVLHAYEIAGPTIKSFAKSIATENYSTMVGIRQIPSRRIETLALGAVILRAVIDASKISKVITSAQGIREGYKFSKLPKEIQELDPLIEDCKVLGRRTGRFPEHADSLMQWIDPLFVDKHQEKPSEKRLRYAACLLADISWESHPDFKASRSFFEAFYGHFIGINHVERAFLALTLYILFGGKAGDKTAEPAFSLLSSSQIKHAVIIGHALRLGQRLTGGTVLPLTQTYLKRKPYKIYLKAPADMLPITKGAVESRLKSLAAHLSCAYEIVEAKPERKKQATS